MTSQPWVWYSLGMSTPTTEAQLKALITLIDLVLDAVKASPNGMPEGHLYAALMTGIPNFRIEHLNTVLNVLEEAGRITRKNYLVKAVYS